MINHLRQVNYTILRASWQGVFFLYPFFMVVISPPGRRMIYGKYTKNVATVIPLPFPVATIPKEKRSWKPPPLPQTPNGLKNAHEKQRINLQFALRTRSKPVDLPLVIKSLLKNLPIPFSQIWKHPEPLQNPPWQITVRDFMTALSRLLAR